MKFPRNARIFRGRLDVAPFAAVFFLLAIFLLLASLVYTPGVRLDLPVSEDLPGTDKPTVAVAVDASGNYYFENQLTGEEDLARRLRKAVSTAPALPVLVVQADKAVRYETLVHLALLGRQAGFSEALLATLPRTFDPPTANGSP